MIRDEIAVLRGLSGVAYRARRDAALASGANLEGELALFVDSPAWEQAVTARILLGHARDAVVYVKIQEAIDAADVAGAQQKASGLGGLLNEFADEVANTWGEAALPCAWEVLLKFGDERPATELLFHLTILRAMPQALSVEVILAFMQGRSDGGMIEASARTLAAFPTALTESRVEALFQKYDLLAGALQRLRIEVHYAKQEGR